ncbi:MAG: hypothetical protein ACJ8D4_21580 [Xanthobacteraceae bacterium]
MKGKICGSKAIFCFAAFISQDDGTVSRGWLIERIAHFGAGDANRGTMGPEATMQSAVGPRVAKNARLKSRDLIGDGKST